MEHVSVFKKKVEHVSLECFTLIFKCPFYNGFVKIFASFSTFEEGICAFWTTNYKRQCVWYVWERQNLQQYEERIDYHITNTEMHIIYRQCQMRQKEPSGILIHICWLA